MSSSPLFCALTFDDGPNTTTTVEMLDVLERHGIVASFFLCGDNITDSTAPVVRRAFDMGCEMCNHSRTHPPFSELSPEQMLSEIEYTSEAIKNVIGHSPRFFRPPYIAVNDRVFDTVPLPMICGIGAEDWLDEISAQERHDRIVSQMVPGTIILLHDMDGNEKTVEAVDKLIPTLREMGYEFVTVTQLFEKYGIDPKANNYLYTYVDQDYRMPDWH